MKTVSNTNVCWFPGSLLCPIHERHLQAAHARPDGRELGGGEARPRSPGVHETTGSYDGTGPGKLPFQLFFWASMN